MLRVKNGVADLLNWDEGVKGEDADKRRKRKKGIMWGVICEKNKEDDGDIYGKAGDKLLINTDLWLNKKRNDDRVKKNKHFWYSKPNSVEIST